MKVKLVKIFLIVTIGLLFIQGCAKKIKPSVIHKDRVFKIGEDPHALVYLNFIKADLKKYEKEPEKALKYVNQNIAKNPNVAYFYYQRAIINSLLGKWEAIVSDLKRSLELNPEHTNSKILLGKALGVLNRHKDAVTYLEKAKADEPNNEDIYVLLAKEYMNMENYRRAEQIMYDLLKQDSEHLVAYYYLGAIYGAYLKKPNKAIDIYKKILIREPDNPQVIDALSELYLQTGRPEKALQMLLKLEKSRPSDIVVKLNLAKLFYKLKRFDEAITRFEIILDRNPSSDKIAYYLGVLYNEVGKKEQAIEMYERIPPESGLYKDARLRLAYNYRERKEIDNAKNVLKKAIRKRPGILEFYQYLAGIYERDGDYQGAVSVIERAISHHSNNESLYFVLATLNERIGEKKAAKKAMRELLKVNPKNAKALNYVGYILVEEGKNLDKAEEMLQTAVDLEPNDGYIIDSLAWLYFKKGDLSRAEALLKKALTLVPDEPTILKHMGQVNLRKGNNERAVRYFKKALRAWEGKDDADNKEILEIVSLIKEAAQKSAN